MERCPSCGQAAKGASECPGCGLIFAKWRGDKPQPATPAVPAATPESKSVGPIGALIVVGVAGWFVWSYAKKQIAAANGVAYIDSRAAAREDAAAGGSFDDWYPADVSPPPGTQYPCALTALPRDLPGIPPSHRRFINHSYALILRAAQAKLLVYDGLGSDHPDGALLQSYLATMREVGEKLKAEETPETLKPFRDAVLASFELQSTFFTKAYEQRSSGQTFKQTLDIPEGRQASGRLQSAWAQMSARYPAWSAETKDSIYHHLCALDLF